MRENLTLINQLKYENERNRENLYQTNLVIEEMQRDGKINFLVKATKLIIQAIWPNRNSIKPLLLF